MSSAEHTITGIGSWNRLRWICSNHGQKVSKSNDDLWEVGFLNTRSKKFAGIFVQDKTDFPMNICHRCRHDVNRRISRNKDVFLRSNGEKNRKSQRISIKVSGKSDHIELGCPPCAYCRSRRTRYEIKIKFKRNAGALHFPHLPTHISS